MTVDTTITPSSDVLDSRVGEETVLLHLGDGSYYGLDAVGTTLWEGIKKGSSIEAIAEQIALEYSVEAARVEGDLHALVAELKERGILT